MSWGPQSQAQLGIALPDLLARSARLYPDKTAVVASTGRLTYRELASQVAAVASGLAARGVRKGDHVGLLYRNSAEFITAYMGASAAGAVVVPLNIRLAVPELAYQIDDADVSVILFPAEFAEVAARLRATARVRLWIGPGTDGAADLSIEELMELGRAEPSTVSISGDDPCVILYTAGTTGFPKGAIRNHLTQIWPTIEHVLMSEMTSASVNYALLPFFHHGGWYVGPLAAFLAGATIVVGGEGPLDGAEMLATFERERVTHLMMVPTMVEALMAVPDAERYDLSSIRSVVVGAAGLRAPVRERLVGLLPSAARIVENGYAQTEATWISSVPVERTDKLDTIGLPSNFVRLRLVDDAGDDVPAGEVGQIVIQGPGVFDGYYKAPEKTRANFVDGWLRTGDLGRFDDEGYLVFAGRARDMLKSGGENVYAAEVERVILQHPEIAEAACIALPDDHWVEAVAAVVVTEPGASIAPEAVTEWCRQHLAGYKCPKRVFFRESLPRTFKGEVVKHVLVAEYSAGQASP